MTFLRLSSVKKHIFILLFSFLTVLNLNAQDFEWVTQHSVTPFDNSGGTSITLDDSGNVYTTGYFEGTIDIDPGPGVLNYTSLGISDGYILKQDPNGNMVWAQHIGGTGHFRPFGIQVDTSGNIYIGGDFYDSLDFDPGPGVAFYYADVSTDAFICKFDNSGNFIWVKVISEVFGISGQGITQIELDVTGNIIAAGYFNDGSCDFDPGPGTYGLSAANTDAFILQLDSDGNFNWVKQLASGGIGDYVYNQGMILDYAGNILMTGYFTGNCDFDPGPGTYNLSGTWEVYVCKLDMNGNFLWAVPFGGTPSDERGYGIACDAVGNVVTVGNFLTGPVDFDPGPGVYNLSSSSHAGYVSKLDANGNFMWAIKLDGSGTEQIYDVKIDAVGSIYLTGTFDGTVDFDPSPGTYNLLGTGSANGFYWKLDPYKNLIWAAQLDATYQATSDDMYLDSANNIFSTGRFGGVADFDPSSVTSVTYTSVGYTDVFVNKISQGPCSALTLVTDTFSNAQCSGPGKIQVHLAYGSGVYSYGWNTIPVDTDSLVILPYSGMYEVTATDSNGCSVVRTYLVNGPDTGSISYDLDVNLFSVYPFQLGTTSLLQLDGFNRSCDTVSGNLVLVLDSAITFNFASIAPDIISGDTLMWNFSGLNYDSAHLVPQVFVDVDSSLLAGDTVCFKVIMDPVAGDADSTNNEKKYFYQVISSYDPNMKSVYPKGQCWPHYVQTGQKMTYTIQFQNTGTAEAINVYVLDTLDVNLDLNSVRIVGNSHALITEVLPGNVLKFRFDGIHLADSTSNELASHGYVIFEIDQAPSLPDYTYLNNKAHIYFDYNLPVATNNVLNTVIGTIPVCAISVSEITGLDGLEIYPNPTNSSITISTANIIATKIDLKDVYGRTIKTVQPNSSSTTMDLQSIESGIYFVTVMNGNSQQTVKIVKQ
jgi:uncharacterized repeat protein (TIGR01451 family)